MAIDPEIHRLTAAEYHQLIDSGGFDDDARIELVDGLLLDMSPRTREHERIIAWLLRHLFATIDLDRNEIRAGAPLSLGDSEPEPDLSVIAAGTDAPYHPATAELVVEVAVSSRTRDLRVKPRLYAGAGVPVYWVIDVERGRAVQHTEPRGDEYGRVEIVDELTAPALGLAVSVADVLASAR